MILSYRQAILLAEGMYDIAKALGCYNLYSC